MTTISLGARKQKITTGRIKLRYVFLSLLLAVQAVFFSLGGQAAATYPGDNGQIITGQQNQLVAVDPETFSEETLKTFDSGDTVEEVSLNSTGIKVAYLLSTSTDTVELRLFNRQTESDQLIREFDNVSTPDANGNYAPRYMGPISTNDTYLPLIESSPTTNSNLLIVQLSDGSTVARYANVIRAAGWSTDGTKILGTSGIGDSSNSFAWFNLDGSGQTVIIPSAALPTTDEFGNSTATSLSPDGQHILYSVTASTDFSVREIDIDGVNDHLLAGGNGLSDLALFGVYSPDSQKFFFIRIASNGRDFQYVSRSLIGGSETELASGFDYSANSNISNFEWSPRLPDVVPDTVPPMVTGVPDRSANANGWYNANVTINWQANDPDPSSGTPTDPANTVASQEGKDVTYTSNPSCDPANNCATGTLKLSIDKTAPAGAFTGSTLVLRLLGGTISGSASDSLSGVDKVVITQGSNSWSSSTGGITLNCNTGKTSCTWSVTTPSSLPLGSNSYMITVTDLAGNTATVTKTYIVI